MQYSGRRGGPMSGVMRYVLVLCAAISVIVAAVPAGAGIIRGVVVFTGALEQKKLPVTIDQYICGKEKQAEDLLVGAQRGVRNAVVWLQTPPPGAKLAERPGQGGDGPESVLVRAARRPGAGRGNGGVPQQRPSAPQPAQCEQGQRDLQPYAAARAGDSHRVCQTGDRSHRLRSPFVDARLGGGRGSQYLCAHRRGRSVRAA